MLVRRPRFPSLARVARHAARCLAAAALAACSLDPDRPLDPLPPGHPIAYVSEGVAGASDIFLLSADASSDVNLTEFTSHDSWPSWSPDGAKIAFESNRAEPAHTDIYVLTLGSIGVQRLTDDTGFVDGQPAWSPLGNRIAFVSNRDTVGYRNDYDVYLMDTDGTNVIRLTPDTTNESQPAWSPDGSQIAFATDRNGSAGEIFVMDSAGGNVVNLTNNAAADLTPAWSPDGSKIAFMSDRDRQGGDFAIWVMDAADGGNPVRVSPLALVCELPSWTPDGLRLVFDCDADLWVANADGTGLTQITRTTNQQRSEVMGRWQP